MKLQRAWRWVSSLQGKLIMASLLISLVPTAIAAELSSHLIISLVDHEVQSILRETSELFLKKFREAETEASGLARFIYEQKHDQAGPIIQADPATVNLAQTLGYGVFLIHDKEGRVLYSNYPVQSFRPLFPEDENALYSVRLPNRTQVMAGGTFDYQAGGRPYAILVGTWLDADFIEDLQSLTTFDLRLYFREPDGFRLVYSSRNGTAVGAPMPDDALVALQHGDESYYDPQAEDGNYRANYLPIRRHNGDLVAVLSCSLRATEVPTVWDLPFNVIALVFLTGTLFTALAAVFVSRRVSKPLRALVGGVTSITAGDYGHRLEVSGNDEVTELTQVFNHMAERLNQLQELEAQLRRRDRMSALGEVAVGIAHEVRNPLGTIKASAELIRKGGGLSQSDAKLLGYVIDEVRRINNLIEEFLAFARPRQPVMRTLPLSQVIRRVSTFCEPELSRHGIELAIIDQAGETFVEADEDHLFQACLNLVLNAIDAMQAGGRLTLRVERQADTLRVSFIDTGVGIPPEIQDRIYDPFFTTKSTGVGLGLAKVFAVMESHRGRIECISRPGAGATFTIVLPVSERTPAHVAHDTSGR